MAKQRAIKDRVAEFNALRGDQRTLIETVATWSPDEIASVMATLHSTAAAGAAEHALRDAVQSVLFAQLTKRLSDASFWLTVVGWVLTVVVGIAGVVIPIVMTK